MDYDYRNQGAGPRPGVPNLSGYDLDKPMYTGRYDQHGSAPSGSSAHFYPRIAQPIGSGASHAPAPVPNSTPSGTGIRVIVKPEYRVAHPVQLLSQQRGDVPRSLFTFDFELERKILAEAERESHGWDPTRANGESSSAQGSGEDPVVAKYLEMGLPREAVVMAVATFGDNQNKVLEFVPSYNLLREMGFPPAAVAGALSIYDNDSERALAHFV